MPEANFFQEKCACTMVWNMNFNTMEPTGKMVLCPKHASLRAGIE